MNVGAIPEELRQRQQWVIWRHEERNGKQTKIPYRADGGGRASSTDAATWSTFEAAVAGADALAAEGIGYVFADDDPYTGIDLDVFDADSAAIVTLLDSYTETSVSGRGAHVIVRASLNGHGRNRKGPLEVYDRGRYFVVTGNHMVGTPATIEDRQEQLDEVLARFLPATTEPVLTAAPAPVHLDDQELLDRARRARNGADFQALYTGSWEGRYPSQSEADLALCTMLAFWTGRDADRIDRIFRSSGLYRPKWERNDYRSATIGNAISGCSDTYSPNPVGVTRASESPESPSGFSGGRGTTDSLTQPYRVSESESLPPHRSGTDSNPESPVPPGRQFSLPVHEFVTLERPNVEPLIADTDGRALVGRHSLTLLGALGGSGKTTWFIDLALHLAAGVDYGPFTVPRPVSILMIENEGPEDLFAAKLGARMASFPHELKARLDVHTLEWGGFSLASDELRARLIEEIAHNQYDLVFGDPLDSLGIEGVGSPEDTRKFMELMKHTGLHSSVAWWLNTHPRKEETKEALNEISGAWGGRPDSVMLLRMLDGDRTQIRFPKLRWAKRGKRPTILLAFDAETEAYTYIGEETEEVRDFKAELAERLSAFPWMTAKEMSAPKAQGGIGANIETVKKVLKQNPDVFDARTGDAAADVGRSKQATVWCVRPAGEPDGTMPLRLDAEAIV